MASQAAVAVVVDEDSDGEDRSGAGDGMEKRLRLMGYEQIPGVYRNERPRGGSGLHGGEAPTATGVRIGCGSRNALLPKHTPLCNVWLTLLKGMSIDVESHGDSTGLVTEIKGWSLEFFYTMIVPLTTPSDWAAALTAAPKFQLNLLLKLANDIE
jgi:hypothetical protein